MSIDGNEMQDSKHRSVYALSAYCPLASKIFGAHRLGFWLKLVFLHSLIMSRLLYQVQLWSGKPKALRNLNLVHMRALRRIAGESRFSSVSACSHHEVRTKLGQPSLDCLVPPRRLLHLATIEEARTPILHALLSPRLKHGHLPWSSLVMKDIKHMYQHPSSHAILCTIRIDIASNLASTSSPPGFYMCVLSGQTMVFSTCF